MNKLVFLLCAILGTASLAADIDAAAEQRIRNSLAVLLPGLVPDTIVASPVGDLYEVTFGMRVVYVTGDGRYLLSGKLIDLETRTEITENRLSELKLKALAEVGEDEMLIYGPDDAPHTLTVFTDIDCGFCRKLHSEMPSYNAQGIRIRYLFYPRAGIGSESYDKAVSVWCADDRRAAMDAAKAGKAIEPRKCENPVAEHYALGQAMRVQGTPALVLEDGEMLPGYLPADKLRRLLDQSREGKGG
ncbi:MAG: DsbC family protein [Chromatiaceae bacterium]|nr:DsbC family protein [Chromatiaceae bacterium]MCP5313530.1 DsbC family protein [Chromatiaceae bacterium]